MSIIVYLLLFDGNLLLYSTGRAVIAVPLLCDVAEEVLSLTCSFANEQRA